MRSKRDQRGQRGKRGQRGQRSQRGREVREAREAREAKEAREAREFTFERMRTTIREVSLRWCQLVTRSRTLKEDFVRKERQEKKDSTQTRKHKREERQERQHRSEHRQKKQQETIPRSANLLQSPLVRKRECVGRSQSAPEERGEVSREQRE
jgi:ribonuclease E